jgi:hypothetical protein
MTTEEAETPTEQSLPYQPSNGAYLSLGAYNPPFFVYPAHPVVDQGVKGANDTPPQSIPYTKFGLPAVPPSGTRLAFHCPVRPLCCLIGNTGTTSPVKASPPTTRPKRKQVKTAVSKSDC